MSVHGVSRAVTRTMEQLSRHSATRKFAAVGLSLAKSVTTRKWHWFSYDNRGWWINRQRECIFFAPTLFTGTLDALERQVDHFWCHETSVRPGNVVVDVGAGTGDHVFVFARRVGPQGRVIAIEAHPATARCLALTVGHNRLTNTQVFEEAAWDHETTLLISDDSMHEGNAVDTDRGTYRVRARPVDDMLRPLNLPSIDFLKMNIEGAELTALKGMTSTLDRAKAVVISCHDFLANDPQDARRTKAAVLNLLQSRGFQLVTRPDAAEPWVRDYVYGRRTS